MTHESAPPKRNSFSRKVNATRVIVSTLGILFAISGMNHGLFEALQGNTPTGGLFVHSIGPRNQMWVYGTEDAFTLIPNFLVTGIAAIAVSLSIVVWCWRFADRKHGASVFLLLFVLLLLVGGGVAQVVFFALAWAVATRIHKPLSWMKDVFPASFRNPAGRLWPWLLGGFTLLGLAALQIAIVGYVPGITDPLRVLHICWSLLSMGLVLLVLSVFSGFVHDADLC